MAQPIATTKLGESDIHTKLHNEHVNVKMFGATGDGTTDDTASIQAAIDAAGANPNSIGNVVFPAGDYRITSALIADAYSVRLTGAQGTNPNPSGGAGLAGTRIQGNFTGPLIKRTNSTFIVSIIVEDLGLRNTHATGECVSLTGCHAPSGVFRCFCIGHKGVVLGTNTFNASVDNCTFQCGVGLGATFAGSIGITLEHHGHAYSNDINGYEWGMYLAGTNAVIGARIEGCGVALQCGSGANFGTGFIGGISMEANDYGIALEATSNLMISGCNILGSANSPSVGSIVGIITYQAINTTIANVSEGGSHATAWVQVLAHANRTDLVFMGVRGGLWTFADRAGVHVMASTGTVEVNILRAPVIATASLPAAATQQNGRLVVEDNGAGDRNLILYAGGQRFRLDGGAAF